jgi:hypothetical protein
MENDAGEQCADIDSEKEPEDTTLRRDPSSAE